MFIQRPQIPTVPNHFNVFRQNISNVRNHMLVCDRKAVHEDFRFLGNESNRYLLKFK